MPARHGLPRKLEQVVKPLGTATGQDRLGLGPFDDRFDLRPNERHLAELDLDMRRPSRQQSRSYQIASQSCSPRREAECRNPQPVRGTEHALINRNPIPDRVPAAAADCPPRFASPQAKLGRNTLMGPAHQAGADRAMLGRTQPVDHVQSRDASAGDRVALERGAANSHVADDPAFLVARQIAAGRFIILAARLEILPSQHLGCREVGIRRA